MVALTFSLGLWQLDRAAQKEKLSQERRMAQPISVNGRWLAEQTLYLDNRQMNAKQGFFVVTPLVTSDETYILVERGWIARNFIDRKRLEPIQTLTGDVTITGRQLADPIPPAVIADNAATEKPIVQYLDLKAIDTVINGSRPQNAPKLVYKGLIQEISVNVPTQVPAKDGLQRDWYEPASGVEKHYGYAFQWFALCALLIGLYIWFQWIKK